MLRSIFIASAKFLVLCFPDTRDLASIEDAHTQITSFMWLPCKTNKIFKIQMRADGTSLRMKCICVSSKWRVVEHKNTAQNRYSQPPDRKRYCAIISHGFKHTKKRDDFGRWKSVSAKNIKRCFGKLEMWGEDVFISKFLCMRDDLVFHLDLVSTGNEQHPQAFPVNRTDYYSCDKGLPHNDRHNSNRWTRKMSGDNFSLRKSFFSAFLEYMKIKTNNCVFYFGDTLTPITAYILKKITHNFTHAWLPN